VGSGIHRCWLGFYEHKKQELISEAVRPNTVFYDVGANVGFYTLLSSVLVGGGKVFAFEPHLRNLEYLKRHIALNHIKNVEVLELAIAHENGIALFEIEPTGSMGCLSSAGQVKVQTASLDCLLAQGKILPPNYIKMDIEGAELLALRGGEHCIRQHRPQIFLATHGPEIHSECCRLLDGWGYECQILDFNQDGLGEVVASPRP
jgi:FkbM family methyltransferase